jgi:hypothetical protein
LFSIFRKKKIDTSTPANFKQSIIEMNPSVSELLAPAIVHTWGKKSNQREYMEILEDLSTQGNVPCQEFATQFYVTAAARLANHPAQEMMYRKALKFGELAADSGVAREAVNLPLTALKLGGILMTKDDEESTSELHSLARFAYQWHVRNSKNPSLSAADRKNAVKQAANLKDAWDNLGDEDEE